MRILLTNDDGYDAPGLKLIQSVAKELAGPRGEVWTVAPETERSGTGHCISYVQPFRIQQIDSFNFKVDGNPADCVLAGIYHVMPHPPDLILSGINRGNNSGENTLYSGTVGAAMEGALQGFKSIALSQYLGPKTKSLPDKFDAARKHALNLIQQLYNLFPWDAESYRLFLNVNFPPCSGSDVKGIKFVRQGFRVNSVFSVVARMAPNGRNFLFVRGGSQMSAAESDTDVATNLDDYVSVTPMRADLTDYPSLTQLQQRFSDWEAI